MNYSTLLAPLIRYRGLRIKNVPAVKSFVFYGYGGEPIVRVVDVWLEIQNHAFIVYAQNSPAVR